LDLPSIGEKEREKIKKRKSRLEKDLKSWELLNLVRIKEFLFKVIIQPPARKPILSRAHHETL
jgi:chromosome segregation and condensation protein ScpB